MATKAACIPVWTLLLLGAFAIIGFYSGAWTTLQWMTSNKNMEISVVQEMGEIGDHNFLPLPNASVFIGIETQDGVDKGYITLTDEKGVLAARNLSSPKFGYRYVVRLLTAKSLTNLSDCRISWYGGSSSYKVSIVFIKDHCNWDVVHTLTPREN